ncbi:MAG: phosphoesterase [Acidobacteriaceae bacterium]|nr:phosphoesterase [Acidobacteriaceae bacterium]
MNCRVFFHDKCFDGACSASLFTRFHRECVGTASSFEYRGLVHKAGALFDESSFLTEGENAVVDFKFNPSEKVTWWFDHHQSAFANEAEETAFRAGQVNADGTSGPKAMRQFFDPSYVSCTGWIAHIASTKFGMDVAPLAELIHWANIVDGAKYESAKAAVEMAEPAMKLTMAIESAPDAEFGQKMIPLLTEMSLQQVLEQLFVAERIAPLLEKHRAQIALIESRSKLDREVITFDIADQPTEGYNKFIPYYLHPGGTYHVGLSKSSFRTKISVGTNPWTTKPASELANIAAICERYGGGGHPRVGAISFPVEKEEDARAAAAEIVAQLRDLAK